MSRVFFTVVFCSVGSFVLAQTNTSLGTNAGNSGSYNTSVGYYSGRLITGAYNAFLGSHSGYYMASGTYNTFLGYRSGYASDGTYGNVYLGAFSGNNNTAGRYNVFLGAYTGTNSEGYRNVFIGYNVGANETGSDKLYIDNGPTSSPLIYGDFSTDFVSVNGNLGVGSISPQSKLDVNGNIQISNADVPMGLMTEVGGTTPLLNMSLNFREPNINSAYLGAGFRIDSRTNHPLFQWIFREAGTSNDVQVMNLTKDGKLGIGPGFGSAVPVSNIEIRDEFPGVLMQANRTDGNSSVRFSESLNSWKGGFLKYDNGTDYLSIGVYNDETTTTDDDIEAITIGRPHGKVGIGILPSENYQLAVNGTIGAKEVNVTMQGWPDYVFKEGYDLPALLEVEEYIKEKKRLPGIPSAEEIKDNGVNLGQMDALLLEKIEEITLYLISQKNQIDAIARENVALKDRVKELERRLGKLSDK